VKVEIIIADLIEEGKKEDIKDVLPILNGWKDISIIVNNAGIDILDTYTNLKIQKITDLLNINCFALGALNYKFIPYFEQRTKETRKKCACINVGSVAGIYNYIKVKFPCRCTMFTQLPRPM
jgi:short-subunit dehydrogenase